MFTSTATALRALAIVSVSSLSALCSYGQITFVQTIDPAVNVSVNNSFNNTEIAFTLPGSGGIIHDVDISVTLSKTRTAGGLIAPFFNEVGLTLSYGAISTNLIIGDSQLINNGATFFPGILAPSFTGTITFDDEAGNHLGHYPVGGTFQPAGSLAVFDGIAFTPGSEFKLEVYDTSSFGGPLIVDRATLTVQFAAVPEPSTYAAAGALLLTGLVLRRRLQKKSAA